MEYERHFGRTLVSASIINIPIYDGKNESAARISRAFLKENPRGVLCALVHGSVACGDEIPYSDFDGLVILKNDANTWGPNAAFENRLLKQSEREMFRFDPLQHHGWFCLRESDLGRYPEHYLPSAILRHCRVLWPDREINLEIRSWSDRERIRTNFRTLCANVKRPAQVGKYPKNMYRLKGVLSQFMLLPALYLHVRDGRAVFKGKSFTNARKDFTAADWAIMDEVSEIRQRWHYAIGPFQRWILTSSAPWHYAFAKRWSPMISNGLRKRLAGDFYQRMALLAEKMELQLT